MLLKLVVIFGYILFRSTYASDTPTLQTPIGVDGKGKQDEPLVKSNSNLIHGSDGSMFNDREVHSMLESAVKGNLSPY